MTADTQRWLETLARGIATAVGALTGTGAELQPGGPESGRSWVATLTAEGDHPGRCVVAFDHAGAAALGGLTSPGERDIDDTRIASLLGDLLVRATGATAGRDDAGEHLDLTLTSIEPRPDRGDTGAEACWFGIAAAGLAAPLVVALSWTPVPDGEPAEATTPGAAQGSRLDVVLDIDLPVVVRFGHTHMPIKTLSRLGPGSVIELGRSPDDPVEVLVSDRVVARGEVVIVGGNYGVRILDVTSQSERARSLEE